MSKVLDSIEDARNATRLLQQRVETVKDHLAIRGDLQAIASEAHELGTSLRELSKLQHADAKNHLARIAVLHGPIVQP